MFSHTLESNSLGEREMLGAVALWSNTVSFLTTQQVTLYHPGRTPAFA
jgi:hypothetical protein